MEGVEALGSPKDTQSLTAVTQDTGSLESLQELVSPTDFGQGVSLHVRVSAYLT